MPCIPNACLHHNLTMTSTHGILKAFFSASTLSHSKPPPLAVAASVPPMPIFLLTPSTTAPVLFNTTAAVCPSTSVTVALPDIAEPIVSVIEI